jgi:hypothetical protein
MSAETHPPPPPAPVPANDFWKSKTAQEHMAEQGVKPLTAADLAEMKALADELWPDDEVDEFIAWVRQTRREGGPPRELP